MFVTSVPDTTSPQVTSVTPASGATNVSTTVPVTVVFSEDVNATSVTAQSFELRDAGGTQVPGSVSYAGTTRTATLQPLAALAHAAVYTATVRGGSSGVRDTAGNPLPGDVTWSFTTAAQPASAAVRDTTAADFLAGSTAGTYVAATADGELMLQPAAGDEFFGTQLPAGWSSSPWNAGGSRDGKCRRADG